MKLTPAKLEANRRNALKSTGPRTAAGRAVCKLNALKHGLCAEAVLVPGEQFGESRSEFKRLRREFHASLAPMGPLEAMLVDQIVQTSWRLRRGLASEAGEIALNLEEGPGCRKPVPPQLQWAQWNAGGDPVGEMENSALGNAVLIRWLEEVRERVEQEGELSEEAVKIPGNGSPNTLSVELEEMRRQYAQESAQADVDGQKNLKPMKRRLLKQIDLKIFSLERAGAKCRERENRLDAARRSAAMLPPAEKLERVLRYQAALERQLYRAIHQLEQLQLRRAGGTISAPFMVEVLARGKEANYGTNPKQNGENALKTASSCVEAAFEAAKRTQLEIKNETTLPEGASESA